MSPYVDPLFDAVGHSGSGSWFDGGFAVLFGTAAFLLLLVHLVFALGVYADGQKRPTYLVRREWWAMATFFGGIVAVAAYWLVHHSAWTRFSAASPIVAEGPGPLAAHRRPDKF